MINHIRITDKEFRKLGEYIHTRYGIKMPPVKRTMLEARLQKRLRVLGMRSFSEYSKHVFSPEGTENELFHMIDMVTTNKTDFFREPQHFDFLVNSALPEVEAAWGGGIRRPLKIWSAGCSSGEEPYTLAIVLSEYAQKRQGFSFEILGSDISTRVLEKAATAVYNESKVDPVPMNLKKKYLLRSKDRSRQEVRLVPKLRNLVRFRRINFMDDDFGMREKMDIIFCRNVIIYFDRPTQEKLLNRLSGHLVDGGFIFMGHSETLSGLNVPLKPVVPTIYRKI
jgi:chemotaxis protein methyltransferase CheR